MQLVIDVLKFFFSLIRIVLPFTWGLSFYQQLLAALGADVLAFTDSIYSNLISVEVTLHIISCQV